MYSLSRPRPDGTTTLTLTPLELMAHLASIIPPPYRHRIHYLGVLAPNAKLRSQVILSAGPSAALFEQLCQAQQRMDLGEVAGAEAVEEPDIPTLAGNRIGHYRAEPPNPRHEEPFLEPQPQATSKTQKKSRRAGYLWAMLRDPTGAVNNTERSSENRRFSG